MKAMIEVTFAMRQSYALCLLVPALAKFDIIYIFKRMAQPHSE